MCKLCSAQALPLLDVLLRHLVHGCVWNGNVEWNGMEWMMCDGNAHRQSGQLRVLGYRAVQGEEFRHC